MIIEQSQHIIDEVSKVFIGKDEIIKKVLMTIYAGGHILLNDAPGTGKTTLALAFSKALGLDYKRIQFTTGATTTQTVTNTTPITYKSSITCTLEGGTTSGQD